MSDKIINLNKEDVNNAEVRYEKEMIKLQIRITIEIFLLVWRLLYYQDDFIFGHSSSR